MWNIRYDGELDELPSLRHFPLVNIVGVVGYPEAKLDAGRWVEPLEGVNPGDLYEAQRMKRPGMDLCVSGFTCVRQLFYFKVNPFFHTSSLSLKKV